MNIRAAAAGLFSQIGGYIKNYGTPNQITGLPAGTPNLLLYNAIYDRRHACCVY